MTGLLGETEYSPRQRTWIWYLLFLGTPIIVGFLIIDGQWLYQHGHLSTNQAQIAASILLSATVGFTAVHSYKLAQAIRDRRTQK